MINKIACAVAGVSTIFSAYLLIRLRRVENSVDLTVNNLADKTPIDVSDAVVEKAIQRAVDRELTSVVNTVNRRLYDEIRREVRESVKSSYSDLKSSVANEIARQVKNVDIREIEKEAVTKAKEAIAEKFDNRLDGLLEDFNENLTNVSKIYSSIAKTMSDKA